MNFAWNKRQKHCFLCVPRGGTLSVELGGTESFLKLYICMIISCNILTNFRYTCHFNKRHLYHKWFLLSMYGMFCNKLINAGDTWFIYLVCLIVFSRNFKTIVNETDIIHHIVCHNITSRWALVFLTTTDTKLQLNGTDGYNYIKSVGSLAAETTVGLLQSLNPHSQVSIKAVDVPSLMSIVTEVMTCKVNLDRYSTM